MCFRFRFLLVSRSRRSFDTFSCLSAFASDLQSPRRCLSETESENIACAALLLFLRELRRLSSPFKLDLRLPPHEFSYQIKYKKDL